MDLSFLDAVGGPRVVVGVVVTVVALLVVSRLMKRSAPPAHTQQRQCSCGWRGTVSAFKPKCPKCGNAL